MQEVWQCLLWLEHRKASVLWPGREIAGPHMMLYWNPIVECWQRSQIQAVGSFSMSESKSAPCAQLVHTQLHSAHKSRLFSLHVLFWNRHRAAPRFNTGKTYMIKREAKVTAENSQKVLCAIVAVRFNYRHILMFLKQRCWNEKLAKKASAAASVTSVRLALLIERLHFCSNCSVTIP